MKEIFTDITIVGGGLIGAATALSLSALGFNIIILEKNRNYMFKNISKDTRTVAISEGTKNFLNTIGIWNELSKFAQPIKSIKIIDRKFTDNLTFDNERRNSNLGYIVKNKKILDIFYSKIIKKKNILILNNIEINGIRNSYDKVEIYTKNYKICSNLNISSDGKNSKVRNLLKTNFYKKNYNKIASVINFSHSIDHNNTAYEIFYKHGPLAILPMKSNNNKNLSSIVWTNTNEYSHNLKYLSEKYLKFTLSEKIKDCVGEVLKIYSLQQFSLSAHINTSFFDKRTIYVGDSAHSFHPIAGQGWNLGMNDVEILYNLSKSQQKLGIEIGSLNFCKSYHNNTFFKAYRLYQITDKLDNLFQHSNILSKSFRKVGINIISKNNKIKNTISDFAMGINL